MQSSGLTIAFLISSSTEAIILSRNPLFNQENVVLVLLPSVAPFTGTKKNIIFDWQVNTDWQTVWTAINTEWLLLLHPWENLANEQALILPDTLKNYLLGIETVFDKSNRYNNLLHYEKRLLHKLSDWYDAADCTNINIWDWQNYFGLHISDNKIAGQNLALGHTHFYSALTTDSLRQLSVQIKEQCSPAYLEINLMLASSLIKEKKQAEAVIILDKLINYFPHAPSLHFLKAEISFQKFAYRQAKEHLSICLNLGRQQNFYKSVPFRLGILSCLSDYRLARIYINQHQWTQAAFYLQRVLSLRPDYLPASNTLEFVRQKQIDNTTVRLSLCMIVKNEAAFLADCLASVQNIADEIIVVDTGSDDNSIEIASQYGAQIFSIQWTNDFAQARNSSIKQASGDWILYLDGDEKISSDSQQKLLQAIHDPSKVAYQLPIRSYYTVDGQTYSRTFYNYRLFRNLPGISFQGKIHEQIHTSLKQIARQKGLQLSQAEIYIEHFGYTEAGKAKDRQNASFQTEPTLLQNMLTDRHSTKKQKIYALTKLATLQFIDRHQAATDYLAQAYAEQQSLTEQEKAAMPVLNSLFITLATKATMQNNYQIAKAYCQEGLSVFPNSLELLQAMATIYEQENNIAELEYYQGEIVHLIETDTYYRLVPVDDSLISWQAFRQYGQTLCKTGHTDKGKYYLTKAAKYQPNLQN